METCCGNELNDVFRPDAVALDTEHFVRILTVHIPALDAGNIVQRGAYQPEVFLKPDIGAEDQDFHAGLNAEASVHKKLILRF